jgi:hypothetical protein
VLFLYCIVEEAQDKMPKRIEGYAVDPAKIVDHIGLPDISYSPYDLTQEKLAEKVNYRAAWRAGVLKKEFKTTPPVVRSGVILSPGSTEFVRHRPPLTEELTDEELERYCYYRYRIWGIS